MKQPLRTALRILIGSIALLLLIGAFLPDRAHGQSSVTIESINARVDLFDEGCLYAFARVEVLDDDGNAVLGLDESHFAVQEDAGVGFKAPLDYFVIPPGGGTDTRAADFIFVMDNSLSLHDEQDAVRDNLIDFIDALTGSGIDFQLGLTRYGQDADDGAPIIMNGGNLTDDAIFFRDNIWAENVTDGNIEPGYHGVKAGVQGFNLRPDAQTVVIFISDEPLDQDDVTQDDAIAALEAADATFYGLVPMDEFFTEHSEALADATDGRVFDITSNFNDILNAISEDISGVYTVGYRSADAFADTGPNPRTVEITVDAGTPITAAGSYTPGARPAVRQALPTAATLNTPAGSDFVVTADVVDLAAPPVSEGTLFYRPTGSSSPFETTALTDRGDGTFEATIPASAMQAPGVDFFFQVSDGHSTVTAPGAAPATYPFQIGVGANHAPEIVHDVPSSFTPGSPLTLAADVADDALDTVTLHYRAQGRIGYDAVAMSDMGGGRYEVSLPPMIVPEAGLDYYIRAEDAEGVTSTYGTPDRPVVLGGCASEGGGECTLARLVDEDVVLGEPGPDHILIEIEDLDDGIQGIGFVQQTDPDDPTPDPLNPDDWEPALINSTATFLGSTDGTFVDAATLADMPQAVIDHPGVVWVDSDLEAPHPTSARFKIVRQSGGSFGYFAAVLNGCGGVTYVDPIYDAEADDPETHQTVSLARNYPNPFADATTIDVELPEATEVSLVVYDMLGRRVATLVNGTMDAGTHTVRWDGRWANGPRVASGVYFYRLEAGSTVQTRRMVVVR